LDKTLEVCRQIYNKCLEERKTSYEKTGVGLKATAQMKNLERFEIENLKSVHSQVIQDAVWRVDSAFMVSLEESGKEKRKSGIPDSNHTRGMIHSVFPKEGLSSSMIKNILRFLK